jgi:hypothetical protein
MIGNTKTEVETLMRAVGERCGRLDNLKRIPGGKSVAEVVDEIRILEGLFVQCVQALNRLPASDSAPMDVTNGAG